MSSEKSLKSQAINGVFWSSIERFSVQGIQFVLQIFLARLLTPNDYGIIGMTAIFMAVSQVFIDSGFSNALIRKTDRTEIDCSTVFYFNIIIGVVCYFLIFFFSPVVAKFYEISILNPVLKVLALNLIINSFAVVQRAKLTINLDFKKQTFASLIAVLVSGGFGLFLAAKGFGVWALVVQQIINNIINTVLLWCLIKWKPLFKFSWKSFRELFGFGSKILFSGLLDRVYKNLYSIVIGKKFNSTDLGYYTRADQFAQFPSSNITGILNRVAFPVLSKIQDDDEKLASVYRKYLRLSAFIIFPLMMGLAAVSYPFIELLLTEKWITAAQYMQIICFSLMWYPIHGINLSLLQVKGRSDLFLRLEIIKKIIGVIVLCITLPFGIKIMCYGHIVSSLIGLVINTYYTGRIINVGFIKQMKDILPSLIYSISMFIVVYFSIGLFNSSLIKLICGIIIGFTYYLLIVVITKSKDLQTLISIITKRENNAK